MTEKDVFQFYNDYVKILYSEIEARNNTLPVELLFEIHSAFDHLKRIYIDKDDDLSGFITWFDVKFKRTPNTIKYTTRRSKKLNC